MLQSSHTKILPSHAALLREQAGHKFLRAYFSRIPDIIAIRTDGAYPELDTCRVDIKGAQVVSSALREDKCVDMRELFAEYASISNAHGTSRIARGATQLFYLDRCPILLTPEIHTSYAHYLAGDIPAVGSANIEPKTGMLDELSDRIQSFRRGYCIPSQGDLHERNMTTNQYLLDFEGSGWNLLASDIATTVWHTIFAGAYFGPKYAKWKSAEDTYSFQKDPKQLELAARSVQLHLAANRQRLLNDYVETYIDRLDVRPSDNDICTGIAFRLLTVFPVSNMDTTDRAITFTLANFFMDPSAGLAEKLSQLDENLQVVWPKQRQLRQQHGLMTASTQP